MKKECMTVCREHYNNCRNEIANNYKDVKIDNVNCIKCIEKERVEGKEMQNPFNKFNPENDKTDKLVDSEGTGMEMPKGILEEFTIIDIKEGSISLVRMEDYLKVVEVKGKLKEDNERLLSKTFHYKDYIKCLEKEKEELREHVDVMNELMNQQNEVIKDLKRRMDELQPQEVEKTYTLIYGYFCEIKQKECEYKQTGLLKEEYEEMYGMDSDNWLYHALVKE